MYIVCEGQKIKNVKVSENNYQHFYGGDKLPKDYEPPKSYIDQKMVKKLKGGK